ncbi:MAG: DNA repair protein RecN [Ruminococcaceae bacterium]|nr:DNA repair protein RecN [Oscillospiraceae bacterium]
MLSVLKIRNIAIIENAEIEFNKGFNVLTGETGAGKSIILDSINAVLGFRTSRELIRTGETEAEVTALFSFIGEKTNEKLNELGLPLNDDNSLLITRTITADKNVCRVNNSLTSVSALREIGTTLISIHGQQDNRELLDNETHISYLDAVAENTELSEGYKATYKELCDISSEIRSLMTNEAEKARLIDILSFQIDELTKAGITVGEWEELKNKRTEIQNIEKISEGFKMAESALSGGDGFTGAVELVSGATKALSQVSAFSKTAEELSTKLNDIYYELSDISDTLRFNDDSGEYTRNDLELIEERLDLLYRLSKKYGATEEEMLEFLAKAEEKLNSLTFSEENLEALKEKRQFVLEKAQKQADELSASRKETAKKFEENVMEELRFLDMPNVQFNVNFSEVDLCENGIDSVEFLISANVGEPPKPIAKIASGGELSRIMLALKNVLSDKDKIGTMIFDEVDTGVSGRAATKVAQKLKEVSTGRQVICVTHLAQLAVLADNHYLIEKTAKDGKTYTNVTPLDFEGRKYEIARITGGGEITETQLKNAEEMLGVKG